MEIKYDKIADAMYIRIKKGVVKKTARFADLVLADMDKNGNVLGVEILGASIKYLKNKNSKTTFNIPVSVSV